MNRYKMDKKASKDQKRSLNSLQLLYEEEVYTDSLKDYLYEVLYLLFHSNQIGGKNLKYKKIRFVLSNLFQSLQMIGILLKKQDIENWESYNFLWDVLQYIRLDHVASEQGVFFQVSFVIEIVLIVQLVCFVGLVLALYNKKPPPFFIFFTLKMSFIFIVFGLQVPIQVLLQSLIISQISETINGAPVENIPFALLAMASFIFFFIVCIVGQSEIRHLKENIESKSCCRLEISTFAVRFVGISYFAYKGSSDMIYLCIIVIIGELYLIRQCVSCQYYYDHFANQVKALSFSTVFSSAIAVLVANIVNNAAACVLIMVLVTPILSTGVLWWMPNNSDRVPNIKKIKQLIDNPQEFQTFLDVEEVLRPFFIFGLSEMKDLVLRALSVYFTSSRKNRKSHLVVWEAYYCLEILKNERLARIKLTKRLVCDYSLEGDFQAFVLVRLIMHGGSGYFKEIDFLQFRLKLDEVRETDAVLCKNFLELMEELTETHPKAPMVYNLIKNISKSVRRLEHAYDVLCTSYKTNREVFELYRSFLAEIMKNESKSKHITDKFGQFLEEDTSNLEYFDSKNAIMIVSGNYNNLGIISYANEFLIQLLQEPDIVGKNIEDFIPSPFSTNHNKFLERYIYSCTDTKINLPRSMFLLTSQGYMIELYIKIKCIALNSYPVFLVILKPKNIDRELAILEKSGCITSHTQNMSSILGLKFFLVNGFNLEDYVMEHGLCEWKCDCFYYILNEYKVYYTEKKIHSSHVKIYKFYRHTRIEKAFKRSFSFKQITYGNRNSKKEASKKLKIITDSVSYSREEQEAIPAQNMKSSQGSERDRRKIISLVELPAGAIRFITICLVSLNLIIAVFTISQGIYILNGLDPKMLFKSLKTINDLEYSYLKIANEARMVDLINYQDTYSQTIIPFQDFMNYNKYLIDMLKSHGLEDKLYDQNLGYWEGSELKYANLIDFAVKLTAYSYDYFEKDGNLNSYKFIIRNSKSIPYEYMKDLLDSLKLAIYSTQENYDFIVSIMVTVNCGCVAVVLVISLFLSMKLRHWTRKYWHFFLKYISENHHGVQRIFVNRLEFIHKYREVMEMYRPFRKVNWTEPTIPVYKYIWRNIALGMLIFSYYSFFSYYSAIELKSTINERVELTINLGESTVEMQALNFWTREMMYSGSLDLLLSDLNPLEDTESYFSCTHSNIDTLFKRFLKREKAHFIDKEVEVFYDTTNYENAKFIAGIHGSVKVLLLDSKYFSLASGNKESMYKEFVGKFNKADDYLKYFLTLSLENSESIINEKRNSMVLINFIFLVFILVVSLSIFIPFVREEKEMLQHKHIVLEIIRLRDYSTR